MQYKLIVGIAILLGAVTITGAGCATTNQTKNPADQSVDMMKKEDAMTEAQKNEAMMEQEKMESEQAMMEKQKMADAEKAAMMDKEKTMTPEEKMMADKESMMEKNTAGEYKNYSASAFAEATKNGGKAVLFFWASWCPDCKASNANFLANMDKIPHNVTVFKTNYDTEKALKTKYGVTYQHTFIQVDAAGNQISRWNGGGVAELLSNVK